MGRVFFFAVDTCAAVMIGDLDKETRSKMVVKAKVHDTEAAG